MVIYANVNGLGLSSKTLFHPFLTLFSHIVDINSYLKDAGFWDTGTTFQLKSEVGH